MNYYTMTIAQLEDQLQTLDSAIASERADEQRGTTRFSRIPGLLAERDQVVAAIQMAREPKDLALELAQAIVALRTHDPIMIARLLRERVAGLQELQGLTAGIEAQRAFAQQSVPAVPKGWQLVPVESNIDMEDAGRKAASRYVGLGEAGRIFRAMLAAAPAAPVAQEPVRELIGYACDRRGALIPDRCGECLCWPAHEDAPPAAEQPTGTTSDQYRAELYDEVWEKARSMGYGNVTDALAKLERLKAAEQPDTVKVPRELAELIDTAVRQGDWQAAREAVEDLGVILDSHIAMLAGGA